MVTEKRRGQIRKEIDALKRQAKTLTKEMLDSLESKVLCEITKDQIKVTKRNIIEYFGEESKEMERLERIEFKKKGICRRGG